LRGQDPEVDYLTLTRDWFSLRVNHLQPDQSLILLKPTTQVSHDGGLRFQKNSKEYDILQRWITAGMRNDLTSAPNLERIKVTPAEKVLLEPVKEVQIQVQAEFSDHTSQDVTSLAVYEHSSSAATVSHDGLVVRQSS